MGHRTLSLALVFRALFLHPEPYEELREDDNPFIEGLFLVTLIAVFAALLGLVGQIFEWASLPGVGAMRDTVLAALQGQSWWPRLAADAPALAVFQRVWDAAWTVLPSLFGMPDPLAGALNVVVLPVWAIASWLLYGLLAHGFARLFYGAGTLSQTLGTTALAFTPWLLYGLEVVPFLAIGSLVSTWQLLLRYRALRTAHRLTWWGALWATILPFAVYLIVWLVLAGLASFVVALVVGR